MSHLEKEVLEAAKKFGYLSVPTKKTSAEKEHDRSKKALTSPSSTTTKPPVKELFTLFLKIMKDQHGFSAEHLLKMYHQLHAEDNSFLEHTVAPPPHKVVPVEIFSTHLSPSEALCKFLKEHTDLSFAEIAKELNRDDRSIWTSYSRAQKKDEHGFAHLLHTDFYYNSYHFIPLQRFQNRSLSILEHVVQHMKQHGHKNKHIAQRLNKSSGVIATIVSRIKQKTS